MNLKSWITLFLITALMGSQAYADPDLQSANYQMPACRKYAMEDYSSAFESGHCVGSIDALMSVSPVLGFCLPPTATTGQGVRVVVHYIDGRPERLHQNFIALAIEALRAAWPCQR
jgi:hypothetical protein